MPILNRSWRDKITGYDQIECRYAAFKQKGTKKSMKKKIISMLLCMAVGMSVAACGGKTENSSSTADSVSTSESASAEIDESKYDLPLLDKEEYELEECITLGEYKNLSFTRTVEEVTDEEIFQRISNQITTEYEEVTDPDAAVQSGDTAVIEYVGKKDGVAFEGGTSTEPYELQIGSGTFIDGFEDGVIGMKAGETKDLNLTFPENYGSEELAGQDVVFTVTVNSIKRPVSEPLSALEDIDDEWVKKNAGEDFANAEEYVDSFRKVLQKEHETAADNTLYSDVWTSVRDQSTFTALPKKLVETAEAEYDQSASQMAEMYGSTLEDLIASYGEDQYLEEKVNYAKLYAMNDLLLRALMEAEGMEKEDDDYKKALDELVESVGAASADELISSYGQEEVDDTVLKTVAVEKILSYAEVTEA